MDFHARHIVRLIPAIGRSYVTACAIFSASLVLLVLTVMAFSSMPAIQQIGWQLFTQEWSPINQQFGILPMLYGSLVVAGIALSLAVPLGITTALFISEQLNKKHRLICKTTLEILAGIPSIIYGLIGVVFLAPSIGTLFDIPSGRTFLAAGIVLALMILPTIITLCDDALRNIPEQYRENAKGLGLYPYEVLFRVLLPMAGSDIIAAVLLALGRALGETMAVMLIIGGIDRIPDPVFNLLSSGQTVTSKLGREIAETAFGSLHFSALIVMGLVLMLIVLLFTGIAQRLSPQQKRAYE